MRHVYKLNEIFKKTKSFGQKFVILHAFLNQVEPDSHYSFIVMNDAYFNWYCLSHAKKTSETLVP